MSDFWSEPQGAAVFKHAVLRNYVPVYVRKVGRFAAGRRVGYLDGFAGPGTYDDGTPASPTLALAAAEAVSGVRDMRCYFVERDRAVYDRLAGAVAASPAAGCARLIHGDIAGELAGIMADLDGSPLFAFLDPFGLGLPFSQLTGKLMARSVRRGHVRTGPSTEVMINFVHAGLYRTAGKLAVASSDPVQLRAAEATVAEVNDNLGGDWWRAMWAGPGTTPQKLSAIRDEYLRRVLAAAGSGWVSFRVPISDTWRGKPIYDLILLTQHPQGIWFFNEAVSLARAVFREHAQPEFTLIPQLWEPDDEWEASIEHNLRGLLSKGRPIALIDQVAEVYGDTLGFARAKHVRKALRRLHAAGWITAEPKGDVHALVVLPTAKALSA